MGFDKSVFQFYNESMKKGIILVIFLSISLSFVHPANVSILPYGINIHLVDNDVLQKVVDAGIKWVRTGANWSAVEISKGTFDWTQVPDNPPAPLILAGGLTAENINAAIKSVNPYAVDVSSGVESAKGIKSADKMLAFMKGVQDSGTNTHGS